MTSIIWRSLNHESDMLHPYPQLCMPTLTVVLSIHWDISCLAFTDSNRSRVLQIVSHIILHSLPLEFVEMASLS